METIKLTQYSHGAGCGCKISPAVLDSILQTSRETLPHPNLLVGNSNTIVILHDSQLQRRRRNQPYRLAGNRIMLCRDIP